MKKAARWAILGGLGLIEMALGAGTPAAAPTVSVEYVPPHLTVRISESTDLHTVLRAVCTQTQARCDLFAPVAAAPVAAATLTGSWVEVVTRLLAGAGLNVTAAPTADSQGAQLVVLGPSSPAAGTAAPAPTSPAFAVAPGIPLGVLVPPPAPRGTTMVLPFPDPSGNPIVLPIPQEPLKVLPFPGPDGQPMPIPSPPPGQKPGWPFPPPAGSPTP